MEAKNIVNGAINSLKISIGIAEEELVLLRNRRRDICNGCEFRDEILNRCKKCGCFIKMKTAAKDANCPINKW